MDKDVLRKIEALRSKIPENGATEGEAMAALEAAMKLMEKHGLTEEDLQKTSFDRDMSMGEFTQEQKQMHPAAKFCAVKIAEFCGTDGWASYDKKRRKTTKMFGFHGDVEMAIYLLELIKGSMDRGWKEYLSTHPKVKGRSRHSEYWSFMFGFGDKINSKIDELIQSETTTGTDLVLSKKALVEQGRKTLLPDLKIREARSSQGIGVYSAVYGKGEEAGDRVNLSRPVSEKRTEGKKIT